MATNIADGLKLAARPTLYDNDERTWLEFHFKLENYLTLVNEVYVALLQDAESQTVVNVTAGKNDASVLIRTLSHTPRQIWLRIGSHLKRCEFHVVDMTKPILSFSNFRK